MNLCSGLDNYCGLKMKPDESREFEEHLEGCDRCGEAVTRWRIIGEEIRAIGAETIEAQPLSDGAVRHRLIVAVESGRNTSFVLPRSLGWAVAAALLLVLGAVLWVRWNHPSEVVESSPEILEIAAVLFVPGDPQSRVLELTGDGAITTAIDERVLVNIGSDVVGIGAGSRTLITQADCRQTRIRLETGTVGCAVEPRSGGSSFVVETDRFEVKVVGTRFAVTATEPGSLQVRVNEGIVEVSGRRSEPVRVAAGESLYLGTEGPPVRVPMTDDQRSRLDRLLSREQWEQSAPREEAFPEEEVNGADEGGPETDAADTVKADLSTRPRREKSPSLADLQQWVLAGRVDEAERELRVLLERQPGEAQAWFLLADCRKRCKDFAGAVAAYREVNTRFGGRVANTARYRAGSILQDRLGRHDEAVGLFEQFLERTGSGHQLEADAKFRLARSLLAQGLTGRARGLLRDLVENHSTTAAASKAQKLLEQ